MLLPIAQRTERQPECLSELSLRHSEPPPQYLYPGNSLHSCELFIGERLRVRVRLCGGDDLFIRHGVECVPIGVAARQWITRIQDHDHFRSIFFAHLASPSGQK